MHTAKCLLYTERIALASSSKELHQIVNTLSNRHPSKILPAIYPSADHSSFFIRNLSNDAEKLRAYIASETVTSTHFTGTTTATFSSFENVSLSTMKEYILNSDPMSRYLGPIIYKLLIECLDFIRLLTLIYSTLLLHLASSHNASNQLLSHLFSRRCVLIPMIRITIGLSLINALLLMY